MRWTLALALLVAACGPAIAGGAPSGASSSAARFSVAFDAYYVDEVNNDEGTNENGFNPGVNIDAAFGTKFASGSGAQLDLRGSYYPTGRSASDNDWTRDFATAAVHFYMPGPDHSIAGLFGGAGLVHDTGDTDQPQNFWFGGVEMQNTIGNLTYFGQLGFLDGNDEYDEGINQAGFFRIGSRIFPKPGTSLMTAFSGAYGMQDNGDELSSRAFIGNIEAEVEHAVSASASLFVSYQGTLVSFDGGEHEADFHDVMVGLRWYPGATSLKAAYQEPASLSLPPVDRWFALTADETE